MKNNIKLTVEVKDGNFCYEYEIGKTRHSGTTPISADNLVRFTHLLDVCSRAHTYHEKEIDREFMQKVYEEKLKSKVEPPAKDK